MSKLKTKKSASKRFSKKPSGKLKHGNANRQHIATKKTRDRKNHLKKGGYVHSTNAAAIKRCMPYA